MSNISAVNHLRQYEAAKLDGRTREILTGDLNYWLTEHKRIMATILTEEGRKEFKRLFAEDVADVNEALAKLEAVNA